jgi:voltage-gated potassium channel
MRGQLRTGLNVIAAVLAIVVVGTVGYTLIEGWSLLDSLFMTVTTIFTVGFGEVHPLSRGGQIFTLLLIIGGVGTILYGLGRMVEFVIGGQLSGMFRRRAVRRQVDKLDSHFIVCGYGRVGEAVARHFAAHGAPFLVVDSDAENVARVERDGFLSICGDATADEVLQAAGIERARGLVAALGSDAGNIFLTLSARVLNPKLLIVARAGSDDIISKLQRAGADNVVTPYDIGGKRMATLMLKPMVSDYLEVVTGRGVLLHRPLHRGPRGAQQDGRYHPGRAAGGNRRVRDQSRSGFAPQHRRSHHRHRDSHPDNEARRADNGFGEHRRVDIAGRPAR